MDDAAWDQIMKSSDEVDAERARCLGIVRGEIESGRLRGAPETSGAMLLLARIVLAIERG